MLKNLRDSKLACTEVVISVDVNIDFLRWIAVVFIDAFCLYILILLHFSYRKNQEKTSQRLTMIGFVNVLNRRLNHSTLLYHKKDALGDGNSHKQKKRACDYW